MTDYISREAFLERIDGIWDCADMVFEPNDHCCRADDCASCKWVETKNAIRKIAANFPAADVREVKRGKWSVHEIYKHEMSYGTTAYEPVYKCSACGNLMESYLRYDEPIMPEDADFPRFCPNCGADMRPQPPKEE